MEFSSLSKLKVTCAPLFALVALAQLLLSLPVQGAIVWHWEEDFTELEQETLVPWLTDTHSALERFVGPLPFDVHVYMHRRDGADQPVPWANTRRNNEQALYFYVNPEFDRASFMDDWTAAHEFSHLVLPYLGSANAWFAEGFASYMQHSVMVESGAIDDAEAFRRRDLKMKKAVAALADTTVSLPENMPDLKARRSYPTFYWGGAVYFERVDAALKQQDSSLPQVLSAYLQCCRMHRPDLDALVSTLDRVSDTSLFSRELALMRITPGVPARPLGS
ncbi:hypothetical protein R0137_10590 [Congregibacter brevis]|uniref:Peptidase M61 catalytic domain-containing protein n=1 Tax=Congregibacter brevis TaxID=3081201 RepID=A0ABZ0I846_9GAMM|nr:hypothetical protein R0137_10590 [Congregibacter sp. IMCC45268]